jgi:hypothetical protein
VSLDLAENVLGLKTILRKRLQVIDGSFLGVVEKHQKSDRPS